MKQILILVIFGAMAILRASAQNDTTGRPDVSRLFYFNFGISLNYMNVDGLNVHLIPGDKDEHFETIPPSGKIGIGLNGRHSFFGLEYERGTGGSFSDPFQNASLLTFSHISYQYGHHFNEGKRVSYIGQIGLGFTNFTLSEYSSTNSISFDSLTKQTVAGKAVGSSIDLFSHFNFYLEPRIGIVFKGKSQLFNYEESTIIYASYRYYTNQVNWFTTGGQFVTNMPLNIRGIPSVSVMLNFRKI